MAVSPYFSFAGTLTQMGGKANRAAAAVFAVLQEAAGSIRERRYTFF
jgi:hypothetical protein